MNSDPLTPQLQELEGRLRGRSIPGPSANLRFRIMQAVGSDLSLQTPSSSPRISDRWYWVAIAAAGVIAMNLCVIDSTRTEFSGGVGMSPPPAQVEPLREILPLEPGAFK
jgi:hypothetical protein